MRVLVVAAPLTGHLLPLVPLAAALRDLGHDVTIASGGELRSVGGMPVHDVAAGASLSAVALRLALRRPWLVAPELRGTSGTATVGPLFGAVNARMLDDVVALARLVRPDVIVHEPLAVAGSVAAAALGVPAVLVENTLWDGAELLRVTFMQTALGHAAARHGVDTLPAPATALITAPASVVGHRPGRSMRVVAPQAEIVHPEASWLFQEARRPRLLVSHSTIASAGSAAHVGRVVAAAAETDAEVVVVRAPGKLVRSGLPPNVRTLGWVPLPQAMPHASAIVHHGGAGTVLAALAAGLPQLVVPGAGDRRHNARLIAARGAGLAVPSAEIDAAALQTLLTAEPLQRAAAETAAEIAAMPHPDEVAAELPTLVG